MLAACSDRSASADNRHPERVAAAVPDPAKPFQLVATGYRPGGMTASGSVIGTINLDSLKATSDSTHPCETGTPTPAFSRAAVVWISGLTTGKAMPVEKRADLASEDCGLDPSIVATTVGSTINVYNDDAALHRLVFKGASLDKSVTMPFFNTGQVVASDRLAKRVGLVNVTCALHPWTHATIAVFDQPYFAVTDDKGRFSLDSVPPGTYTLMIWRADLTTPVARSFQVSADKTTSVNVGAAPDSTTKAAAQPAKVAKPKGKKRSATMAAKRRAK